MTLSKTLKGFGIAATFFGLAGCLVPVDPVLLDPTGTYEVEWSTDVTAFWDYVDGVAEEGSVLLEDALGVFPGDLADANMTVDFYPNRFSIGANGSLVISGNANFIDGTIEIPVTLDSSFDFEAATTQSIVLDQILFSDLNCVYEEIEDFDFDWGSTDWDFNATVQRQYVWTDLDSSDVDYVPGFLGCDEDLFAIYPEVIADLDSGATADEIFFFADLAGLVPDAVNFELTGGVGYFQGFRGDRVGLGNASEEGQQQWTTSTPRNNNMARIAAAFASRGFASRARTALTAPVVVDGMTASAGIRLREHGVQIAYGN